MEEITLILSSFCESFKTIILEYYNRCYSYIKDLYADKSIDLKFKITYENEKIVKDTVESMVKTTKIALSTIGVSKSRIALEDNVLKEISSKKGDDYQDYNSYFQHDLKKIATKILFEILLEYLADAQGNKIENLDLFDLLPRNFLAQIDQFKRTNVNSPYIKKNLAQQISQIENIVNPLDLSLKVEIARPVKKQPEKQVAEIEKVSQVEIERASTTKSIGQDLTIFQQLEEAKKINLEALKSSIKKSVIEAKPVIEKPPQAKVSPPLAPVASEVPVKSVLPHVAPVASEVPVKSVLPSPKILPPSPPKLPPTQEIVKPQPSLEIKQPQIIAPSPVKEEIKVPVKKEVKTFLESFGSSRPISNDIINKFQIEKKNLVQTPILNPEYFTLESLFYYVSIMKMLKLELPFRSEDYIQILGRYINNKIFCISKDVKPDPISIFYGLSVLSELKLLNNTDTIDLLGTEMFLESEFKKFIPEKLHLNLYTILCLKLLERNGGVISDKTGLLNQILNFDITSLEQFNPTLDIYEYLSLLKSIDNNVNITHFKALYISELKKMVAQNGSIKDTVTDSARMLLVLDLLEAKSQEYKLSREMLNYVSSAAKYFNLETLNPYLNWQMDALGYTVELRMLYWALLASSQYPPIV